MTPAECVFGRSLYFPLDYELSKDQSIPSEPFAQAMQKYTSELWPALLEYQLNRYNKFMSDEGTRQPIKKGDYVLVWKPQLTQGKLSQMWCGPYRVQRHLSPTSFWLIDPETGAKYRRSIRHMRKIGPLISERIRTKYPEIQVDQKENEVPDSSMRYDFSAFPFPETLQNRS